MDEAMVKLKQVWGFDALRGQQDAVIRRLLEDEASAALIMPTGGGKSLCFQLPALCLPGLTLVVSPLIALMKDQVDGLKLRGVNAAAMDSSQSADDMSRTKQGIKDGSLKILYVAPERLNNEQFVLQMRDVYISLLAVDESHCISAWGHSFRPEYLKVARFAKEINAERVLALTATATPEVAADICQSFDIDKGLGLFTTSPFRANLKLTVEGVVSLTAKVARLVPFLQSRTGPAICYVTRQQEAEDIVRILKSKGVPCMFYHAGMSADDRKYCQDKFMKSAKDVVVATIAFGMGIDKADIRQVVHINLPKTLENYSQEIGRAGRDGQPSECLLFLCAADLPTLEGFARGNTPSRRSIRDWLATVCKAVTAEDGCIDFSSYEQSKTFDIRPTVLGLLFASLELEHGYLRAVTPYYSKYDLEPIGAAGLKAMMGETGMVADLMRSQWKKGTKYYGIDVVAAAAHSKHVTRNELASLVSRWERAGHCTTKPSIVRNRYHVLKPLPKEGKAIDELTDSLFASCVVKERDEVARLRRVIELATSDDCIWQGLCSYFGDDETIPGGQCTSCSWCVTASPATMPVSSTTKSAALDPKRLEAVLAACPVRDDARLLSRFAFGIPSPRITQLGLGRDACFGSMDTCDFEAILEYFEKACAEAGYKNEAGAIGSAGPKKRSAPAGGSRGRGGTSGGGAKRGRK